MKKNQIILLLSFSLIVIIFIVVFLSFLDNSENDLFAPKLDSETSIILFTGETCPHCKDVENYVYDNNLENILDLSIKEVYNDLNNAQLFEEKFENCLFQPREYGIPLLWHERNCILGPVEIINYLNSLSN